MKMFLIGSIFFDLVCWILILSGGGGVKFFFMISVVLESCGGCFAVWMDIVGYVWVCIYEGEIKGDVGVSEMNFLSLFCDGCFSIKMLTMGCLKDLGCMCDFFLVFTMMVVAHYHMVISYRGVIFWGEVGVWVCVSFWWLMACCKGDGKSKGMVGKCDDIFVGMSSNLIG